MSWRLKALLTLLIGSALAAASAWVATGPQVRFPERNGAWRTSAHLGNQGDEMYLRASLARIAWFSNDPGQSMYYEAREDTGNDTLDIRCNYRIAGGSLPARWWSLTAYRDFHWFSNDQQRYSFTKTNLVYQADGTWRVLLGPQREAGNWLPMGGEGRLTLLLRLFDVDPVARATFVLPRIEKVTCS